MIPKFSITERSGRAVTRRDGDGPDWDAVVARLIGPTVAPADRERRRSDALALAAAALRAAGDNDLEELVLARANLETPIP